MKVTEAGGHIARKSSSFQVDVIYLKLAHTFITMKFLRSPLSSTVWVVVAIFAVCIFVEDVKCVKMKGLGMFLGGLAVGGVGTGVLTHLHHGRRHHPVQHVYM